MTNTHAHSVQNSRHTLDTVERRLRILLIKQPHNRKVGTVIAP
jgi:hypothetical protein